MTSLETFTTLCTKFASYFPSKSLIPDLLPGYFKALEELTPDALEALLTDALKIHTFFPTIAELVSLAGVPLPQPPAQESEQRSQRAWDQLTTPSEGRLYNRQVILEDPVAKEVFHAMGGGYAVGGFKSWSPRQDAAKEKEFLRRYQRILQEPQEKPRPRREPKPAGPEDPLDSRSSPLPTRIDASNVLERIASLSEESTFPPT